MKKILSLMLALMLFASCIPAFADDTYTISASGALKVNNGVKLSGEVVIPDTVDGITVTSLDGFAFNNQNDVTSIVLPDTIQSMSGSAINFLNGLTSVKLSENLTVIGDMNFCAMNGLTSLTIPASVCYIGDSMSSLKSLQTLTFEGVCPMFKLSEPITGLNRNCVIYVPDDQVDAYKAALTNGYGTEEQIQPSGKNAVVYDNPAAESEFVFDAATGTITGYTGSSARLQIPATIGGAAVKAIGEKAFSHNASLFYVVIPEGVEVIGNYAFDYCDNLAVVDFPSTLKKIGDSAFEGCYLTSVGWKEGLEEIGANAFARFGANTLSLPTTVKTIGEAAFMNGSIRKLYIGKDIESIGKEAFANNFLERVELLTDRMIQIDETAFAGNTNDTYVYLRWNVPYDVYKDYEHLFLNIYEGMTYLYIQAPIKDASLGLEYPADGTDSYNQDVWVSYNGTQPNIMTWYSWNRIPITTLGDGLFKGNQTIRSWYCSHEFTMHHIGNEAFADSSVEFVDLYHELHTIGDAAFRNCVNIKEITLPETLTSIAANAFEGCTGLEKITVLCDPSLLTPGMLESCTALKEVIGKPDASEEDKIKLQLAVTGLPELTIDVQPVDVSVYEGEKATVSVEATGEGLTYAWYFKNADKNEFSYTDSFTGNTYALQMNAERDGRQVYCVVTDAYGTTVTSDTVTLNCMQKVSINVQPQNVTVKMGEKAKVSVEATGDGLTYAWYASDVGDTEFFMSKTVTGNAYGVEMNPERDGRKVYCLVTDAYGNEAKSDVVTLAAAAIPELKINVQPVNVSAKEGEVASAVVEAGGEGLTYAWYFKNAGKSEFSYTESFTGPSYDIKMNAERDGRQVYCVVTDAYGNTVTSDTVTLTLKQAVPLAITVQPMDAELPEGEMTDITVEATGEGLSYQWYVMPVSKSDFAVAEGFNTNVYSVPVDFDSDWSQVYCVITDAYGNSVTSETASIYIAEPELVIPEVAVDANYVGYWTSTKADADGMILDRAQLEQFGMVMDLALNEDGSASLIMFGEEDACTWGVANGFLYLISSEDVMEMTIPGDGTISYDGVIFEKGEAPSSDAAEMSEEEQMAALLSMLAAMEEAENAETSETADEADASLIGKWVATSADMEGMILDQAMMATFGLTVEFNLNEDGSATMIMEGEETAGLVWTSDDAGVSLTMDGDTLFVPFNDKGGFTWDMGGALLYFEKEAAEEAVEAAVEETPAEAAVEAASASGDFVGTWHMVYLSSGGFTGDMRPMGVNYTLELRADGTGCVDYPETTEGIWYEEDGFTYFGQGGDNADMPMALMDNGFLQYGSDLGGYLIMSQDPNAVYDPSMGTALIAPGMESFETSVAPAPAAPTETITDVNARLERKFVVTSYTTMGETYDASMLGTEYSIIFHENGTCDFTMAGIEMPNLSWGMQKVAIGLNEVDAFVINYSTLVFNAIFTDTGFDMDYYGTMNLHFVPAA